MRNQLSMASAGSRVPQVALRQYSMEKYSSSHSRNMADEWHKEWPSGGSKASHVAEYSRATRVETALHQSLPNNWIPAYSVPFVTIPGSHRRPPWALTQHESDIIFLVLRTFFSDAFLQNRLQICAAVYHHNRTEPWWKQHSSGVRQVNLVGWPPDQFYLRNVGAGQIFWHWKCTHSLSLPPSLSLSGNSTLGPGIDISWMQLRGR